MDEAKEYKKYLKSLKKATDSVKDDKKKIKELPLGLQKDTSTGFGTNITKLSRGGGIAIQGTKFEGVK